MVCDVKYQTHQIFAKLGVMLSQNDYDWVGLILDLHLRDCFVQHAGM